MEFNFRAFLMAALVSVPIQVNAASYGVSIAWKTEDSQAIFDNMPSQKKAFANLIDAGYIKDMFVSSSQVGEQDFPIIHFVMEADSEQQVRDRVGNLPFYRQELVEIEEIRDLGSKWLDSVPVFENYSVELEWKEPSDVLLVDKVLASDLQKVVDWTNQGKVTSAYLKNEGVAGSELVRPLYSIAVLAKSEQDAKIIAEQLDAVRLGLAGVSVTKLGFKLEL
ncbi:hypothetical protein B6A42_06775 [Vibrio coralliilyticus]|nr:hypothetical protein B6A42_06775 [Vibrio coralliilyticus]